MSEKLHVARVADVLFEMRRKGVRLWIENDLLRYQDPNAALSADDVGRLRLLRSDIIAFLKRVPRCSSTSRQTSHHGLDSDESGVVPFTFQQQFYLGCIERFIFPKALIAIPLRISGFFSVEGIEKSIESVVRRHQALRTRMVTVNGRPEQLIDQLEEIEFRVPKHTSETEAAAKQIIGELVQRESNFSVGRMFKAALISFSKDRAFVVFFVHHLIMDFFTVRIIFDEFWEAYASFQQSRQSKLGEACDQYANYARQQQRESGAWLAEHGPYWNERLKGASPLRWPMRDLDLRNTLSPLAITSLDFGGPFSRQVVAFARRIRIPMSLIMLAAYAKLVSRWCQQTDFVIPVNFAGRENLKQSTMVGYFAHFLYLRLELKEELASIQFLESVKREFYQALSHQDFGRISVDRPDLWGGGWFSHHSADMAHGFMKPTTDLFSQLGVAADLCSIEGPKMNTSLDGVFCVSQETTSGISIELGYRENLFSAEVVEQYARLLRHEVEWLVA